jgi:hypothetical protein
MMIVDARGKTQPFCFIVVFIGWSPPSRAMLAAGSQPAECTLVFGSRPAGRQLAAGSRQFTQLDEAFDGRADDPGGTPTLELGTEPIEVIGDAAAM